jgi:hypothetical protein
VHPIEIRLELGILDAKGERGRTQPAQLLALDLTADPPVGVVPPGQSLERFSRAGEVVEIAATDGLLDRVLDVRRPLGLRGRSSRFGRDVGCVGLFAPGDRLFAGEAVEPVLPRGTLRILAHPRPPSRRRASVFHDTTPRIGALRYDPPCTAKRPISNLFDTGLVLVAGAGFEPTTSGL